MEQLKILYSSPAIKHLLSHQILYTKFIIVEISKPTYFLKANYLKVSIPDIQEYSIPKVIDNFLAAEAHAEKYFRRGGDINSTKNDVAE